MKKFLGSLGLQQRVFPAYRMAFFDLLAKNCTDGMSLFAGNPRRRESIKTSRKLENAKYYPAKNHHYFGGSLYICNQSNILEWLEESNPQALIVEANPRYPSSRRAVKWMRDRNRPVIGWGLGSPDIYGFLALIRKAKRMQFLSSLDALIAYSSRGADQYRKMGLPSRSIFVASNASAPRPVASPPERGETYGNKPVLLYVGRLQDRKRIDLLLRACAELADVVKIRLIIVGDGPARKKLEKLAKKVFPTAEFVGACFGAELADYYREADLFVLPGTGGLAIQEAMSYGLPVIVAEGDGTQSDLVKPENGWILPANNLEQLSKNINEALLDPRKLRRMGLESYRIALEEVNIETMVSVFLNVLQTVSYKD